MIERLDLDVLRYETLVAEAHALLPALCPDWTDHNPSDLGITLIELLAWLTEMSIYRLNRVPEKSYRVFLNLLDGSPLNDSGAGRQQDLTTAIRQTVTALREIDRVVTVDDMAYLIATKWQKMPQARSFPPVLRVRCQPGQPTIQHRAMQIVDPPRPGGILVGTNTLLGIEREARISLSAAPGHLSALVISDLEGWPDQAGYLPSQDLLRALQAYLEPRRLLTTRLHVIGPRVVRLGITATLHLGSDGIASRVAASAERALWDWLHPLTGGPNKTGWPFGRRIRLSDLYQVLDGVPGLDYVEAAELSVLGQPQPSGVDMSDYEIAAKDFVRFQTVDFSGD